MAHIITGCADAHAEQVHTFAWEPQVMMTWLLAHLEEYHTGQLMYSNGWLGVLEANYSLALLSFSSFLFGEQVDVHLLKCVDNSRGTS
eukprot:1159357-Pelagomonas_calceolata.AAC.9